MRSRILDRGPELRVLTRFLESLDEEPGFLVLEGEPGIGKSTLWLACVDEARCHGFRVLTAQPAAAEVQLSHASLADLLSGVDDRVLEKLPGPQRQAVDVVLLRGDPSGVATDPRTTGAALLSIIERLADETPVLLAIDDLQWVDRASRQAVAFAARRLPSRAGLLAGLRAAALDDSSWLLLPRTVGVQHVSVGPLSLGALHTLLAERTGRSYPRPTMVRIERASGGNPFYALELGRVVQLGGSAGLDAPFPRPLAGLVQARIGGLDRGVPKLLLAVASVAEPVTELVRSALGNTARETDRLLAAAEHGGIIAIDGHRLRFTHPLLAAGVYSAASAADRRTMHSRLAGLVVDPEEQARHLALAAVRADQQTVAALDEAADRARSRGAPAAAGELIELAIKLGGDTVPRRLRLAQHHFDAGDPARSRMILEAALPALEPGPSRAETLRLLALVRLHDDSYREAAGYLEQALDEPGPSLGLRVRAGIDLLFVLVNLGRIPDALRLRPDVVRDAERFGDPALLAQALAGSVMVRFLSGQGVDEPALQRALALENPDVPTPVMLRPTLISSLLLAWTGRIDEARDGLLSIRHSLIERGEESDLMFSAFHTVIVECWGGDLVGARLIAEDTMERAVQLGTEFPLAIALAVRANVAAYAGEVETARRSAREALRIFERGSCLAVTVWPMVSLGFLELSLEDYAAAAVTLGPLVEAASVMGYGEPTAAPFAPDAVEALVGVGRLEEAAGLLDQLEDNGRRLDRAWALALGARCRSLLLAAEGNLDGAVTEAQRALVEHDRLPMPFERARTQLVLGQLLRRRRQKRTAATALEAAARAFDELGTPLWAARTRAELERVTVRPAAPAELTSSERRVAELSAGGRTNREVAALLFISPKTVEANLARIYHKLGIRSRAELGRRMIEGMHGETPDSSGPAST